MKKYHLNKRGEILFNIILLIAFFFGVIDSDNMIAFVITKVIALILLAIIIILARYLKEN